MSLTTSHQENFFSGGEVASDPADTTGRGATGMLDNEGKLRLVRDSGHRMILPNIPGVGSLRQRFPIMPIFGEGSSVWKELEALKDIVLDSNDNKHMFRNSMPTAIEPDENALDTRNRGMTLEFSPGRTGHSHMVHISTEELRNLQAGKRYQSHY